MPGQFMRSSFLRALSALLGLLLAVSFLFLGGCFKQTAYTRVPAPAGANWGMVRQALSKSTLVGSSHQEKNAYDKKIYNVYVTRMRQSEGSSYTPDQLFELIEARCPLPAKGVCAPRETRFRPLGELPR